MLSKIKIFLRLLLKTKFKILKENEKKYIIFDREGSSNISKLLPHDSYFILDTRSENLKNVYLSKSIFLNIFKHFFIHKKKIFTSYLISVISEIKPSIIVTYIDNSFKFFEISKLLEKQYKFIAIQLSARYDIIRFKLEFEKKIRHEDLTKYFFIPHYLCFGDYEKNLYEKNKILVKNYQKIGSLKLIQAMDYFKKSKEKIENNKYDICLVSDDASGFSKHFSESSLEKDYAKIASFAIQFSKKFNKKFIFIWKRYQNHPDHIREYEFYRKQLTDNEFNYLLNNSVHKTDQFSSYKALIESKVVIGVSTTMLREKLSLKGKILTCNYTNLPLFNFPKDGIFVLKKYEYSDFENKLNFLLEMSNEEYFDKIKEVAPYIIKFYDNNDLESVKKILK